MGWIENSGSTPAEILASLRHNMAALKKQWGRNTDEVAISNGIDISPRPISWMKDLRMFSDVLIQQRLSGISIWDPTSRISSMALMNSIKTSQSFLDLIWWVKYLYLLDIARALFDNGCGFSSPVWKVVKNEINVFRISTPSMPSTRSCDGVSCTWISTWSRSWDARDNAVKGLIFMFAKSLDSWYQSYFPLEMNVHRVLGNSQSAIAPL